MSLGSLQSQAKLVFRHQDETGQTVLAKRSTGGLFHVSKPYWDESLLLTQLVNPTAGIFEGDKMLLEIELERDSKVALVSPSATRLHTMRGGEATIEQHVRQEEGSFLEFRSDYTIPQKDSVVSQLTEINMEKGSTLLYIERLMPGRVGFGEQYNFERFSSQLKISFESSLLVQERIVIEGKEGGWPLRHPKWERTYMANLWLVLEQNVLVCRVLSPESVRLKKKIVAIREKFGQYVPELEKSSRTLLSNHT